jgi:hypothetical protein
MGQDRSLIHIPWVAYRPYFKPFLNTVSPTPCSKKGLKVTYDDKTDTSGQRTITKYHFRTLLCLVVKHSTIRGFHVHRKQDVELATKKK